MSYDSPPPGDVSRWAGRLCVWDCPVLTLSNHKNWGGLSPRFR